MNPNQDPSQLPTSQPVNVQPTALQAPPVVPTQAVARSFQPGNAPAQSQYNLSVFHPKYLSIIFLCTLVLIFLPDGVRFIGAIVLSVYVFIYTGKLKQQMSQQFIFDDSKKIKTVTLMAIDPIISQFIYYYRLRKTNPEFANKINSFGWKVFGLQILFAAIILFLMAAVMIALSE